MADEKKYGSSEAKGAARAGLEPDPSAQPLLDGDIDRSDDSTVHVEDTCEPTAAVGRQEIFDTYRDQQRDLLISSDKICGITSEFTMHPLQDEKGQPVLHEKEQPVEKLYFERDATKAKLGPVPPDKNISLIKNNILLRSLGTLRGVSHVLASLPELNQQSVEYDLRILRARFEQFKNDVNDAYDQALKGPGGRKKKKKGIAFLVVGGIATGMSILMGTGVILLVTAAFLGVTLAMSAIALVCLLAGIILFRSGKKDAKNVDNGDPKKLQKALVPLAESFNFDLLRAVKKYPFFKKIERSPKEQNKFLSCCRFAAGSLDEAPIVETRVALKDSQNSTYTETCYPATRKTPDQTAVLKSIPQGTVTRNGDPLPDFYTKMKKSPQTQAVMRAFRSQFLDDERALSPQMRNYLPHGLRQGFVVKREIFAADGNPLHHLWSARAGTMVYVGKGEKNAGILSAAQGNLQQLKKNFRNVIRLHGTGDEPSKAVRMHIKMLNSNTSNRGGDSNRQDRMVKMTQQAAENEGDLFSYVPVNPEGRLHSTRLAGYSKARRNVGRVLVLIGVAAVIVALLIATGAIFLGAGVSTLTTILTGLAVTLAGFLVTALGGWLSEWGNPFNANSRVLQAAEAGLAAPGKAEQDELILNLDTCASGIDRTGTQALLTSLLFISQKMGMEREDVLERLTQAGHNGIMSSIFCPGSPGMKSDSRPADLFGEYSPYIYLSSAKTNKDVPLYGSLLKEQKKNAKQTGLFVAILFVAIFLITFTLPTMQVWNPIWLAATAASGLGPALVFTLGGLAALLGLTLVFKKLWTKDWVSAIGRALVLLVVATIILAPLFGAAAWQGLAGSSLLAAVLPLVLISGVMMVGGRWLGGKVGAKQANTECVSRLQEAPALEMANVKMPTTWGNDLRSLPKVRHGSTQPLLAADRDGVDRTVDPRSAASASVAATVLGSDGWDDQADDTLSGDGDDKSDTSSQSSGFIPGIF